MEFHNKEQWTKAAVFHTVYCLLCLSVASCCLKWLDFPLPRAWLVSLSLLIAARSCSRTLCNVIVQSILWIKVTQHVWELLKLRYINLRITLHLWSAVAIDNNSNRYLLWLLVVFLWKLWTSFLGIFGNWIAICKQVYLFSDMTPSPDGKTLLSMHIVQASRHWPESLRV